MAKPGAGRRGAAWIVVAIAIVGWIVVRHHASSGPPVHALTSDVSISGPIKMADVPALKRAGFRTVVDLIPDGAAPDVLSYADAQSATQSAGLGFSYVPLKGDAISRPSVKALAYALRTLPTPTFLYGRNVQQAARIWALAEASRPGGLDAAAIDRAVKSVGSSGDDLGPAITSAIAARPPK